MCEGFAVWGWCWGHCGQVSGPSIHMGRKAPGAAELLGQRLSWWLGVEARDGGEGSGNKGRRFQE